MKRIGCYLILASSCMLLGCSVEIQATGEESLEQSIEAVNPSIDEVDKNVIPENYDNLEKKYSGCLTLNQVAKHLDWSNKSDGATQNEGKETPKITCPNGRKDTQDLVYQFISLDEIDDDFDYLNALLLPEEGEIIKNLLLEQEKDLILFDSFIHSGKELFLDGRKVVIVYPNQFVENENSKLEPIKVIYHGKVK
ncbi:MAG: hypothetical protein ACRCST_17770 [Turicibacter sp.]